MKRNNSEESSSKSLRQMAIILSYLIAISCTTTLAMGAAFNSRTNPSFSLEDISIEPGELLQAEQAASEVLLTPPQPSSFHVINECVKITMDEGIFHFKSRGGEQVCGLYFVADPDKAVVISVEYIDIQCSEKGLVSVVDGWELNGQVFPSLEDHEKPPQERFQDLCIDPTRRHEIRRTFKSTQNAALIQYRVPSYGQGFSIRVQHVENPRPCNILVQDLEAVYKLENFGRRINCSLTTLFDAKIRVIYMSTGLRGSHVKYSHSPSRIHTGIYHKCEKMGLEDYVQIGGSSGLDTSKMQLIEEFCGYQSHPMNKYTTIFCGMTTIRLVSSGKFQNKLVAEVRRADIEDLDSANYICDI